MSIIVGRLMPRNHPAAIVVVLSLAAPALVACILACTMGGHHAMGLAGHHHADMSTTDVRVSGDHACDHDVGAIEPYGPTTKQRFGRPDCVLLSQAFTQVVASISDPLVSVDGRSPPGDLGLAPPDRSLVLLI